MNFDPESSWRPLEERLEREPAGRGRRLLEEVRNHLRAEIRGELEPLMATLIAEPRYHFRGLPVESGPKGHAAVRSFYGAMISGGGTVSTSRSSGSWSTTTPWSPRERCASARRGAALIATGTTEIAGEPVDAGADYLSRSHILTVWPGGEGDRLVGEDIYFGSPATFTKL